MPAVRQTSIVVLDDVDEPNCPIPRVLIEAAMCKSMDASQSPHNHSVNHEQKSSAVDQLTRAFIERPTFANPDWGSARNFTASRRQSLAPLSPRAIASLRDSASCASKQSTDLSICQWHSSASSKLGTISTPIEIEEESHNVCDQLIDLRLAKPNDGSSRFNHVRIFQEVSDIPSRHAVVWLEDDDSTGNNALARSINHGWTESDVLIDLDDVDGFEALGQENGTCSRHSSLGLETLSVQNVEYCSVELSDPRLSTNKFYDRRNPIITSPFVSVRKVDHGGLSLRVGQTVELSDGDFLQITAILLHGENNVVKIRGQRLQRVRDLNGMLGKKLNELCLSYEVDLDDERPPEMQSAAEIDIQEIIRPRFLYTTNMPFPHDRALSFNGFKNMAEASEEGGLTVRWKYMCKYASASDRHKNNPSERVLEHIRADECLNPRISDSARRANWRGETIRGGEHQPTIYAEAPIGNCDFRHRSHVSIGSEDPEDEDFVQVLSESQGDSEVCYAGGVSTRVVKRKNRSSFVSVGSSSLSSEHGFKRTRCERTAGFQSFPTIDPDQSGSSSTYHIDLTASSTPSLPQAIDLTSSDLASPPPFGSTISTAPLPPIKRTPGQKLTYGDAFCGAGGATRGAVLAGLKVHWGFDFWAEACKTWTTNFPTARNYNMFADAFIQEARRARECGNQDHMKVDILHLSPPCQYFSTAHTVDGVNDEMNTASLFAVEATIEVARPRVVTLEQTFGIAMGKFRYYLNALIMMFTSHGFSVRWSIVQLADWGVPQRRKRLIIIASCPGEILPHMPAATHNEHGTGGLKPYATANQALQSIPINAPDHNPSSVLFRSNKPWNGGGILPRTMTTSGGQNYHPSGERDFTLREFATLQGFPVDHVFRGTGVKKQIGNAVPPCVAKVLFESIKRDLDKADGIVEGVDDKDVIMID